MKQIKELIRFVFRLYAGSMALYIFGALFVLALEAEKYATQTSLASETVSSAIGVILCLIPIAILLAWDFIDINKGTFVKGLLRVYASMITFVIFIACVGLIAEAEKISKQVSTVNETISNSIGAMAWMIPILILLFYDFKDTNYKLLLGRRSDNGTEKEPPMEDRDKKYGKDSK